MNRTEGSSRARIPYHGGPCHFRPTKVGCAKQADPDMELRKTCFKGTDDEDEADLEVGGKLWKRVGGHRCKKSDARLVEREGKRGFFQIGGPPLDEHLQECKTSFKAFAMPYEVGFVLDFKGFRDLYWFLFFMILRNLVISRNLLFGLHQSTSFWVVVLCLFS